jgi:hypothetical protein
MSVHCYSKIQQITDHSGLHATIYYSLTGHTTRIEIWQNADSPNPKRLDTRRASTRRAEQRALELLEFWSQK